MPLSGYANRLITLKFPEWSEDPERDPIWIAIRNPKLMPPGDLRPKEVALDDNGKPLDEEAAFNATFDIVAKLVVAWRVYDATANELDAAGNPVDQPLLPLPATPELAKKLPMEFIAAISMEMTKGNPQTPV